MDYLDLITVHLEGRGYNVFKGQKALIVTFSRNDTEYEMWVTDEFLVHIFGADVAICYVANTATRSKWSEWSAFTVSNPEFFQELDKYINNIPNEYATV